MKNLISCLCLYGILTPSFVFAQDIVSLPTSVTLSGSASIVSDYTARGIQLSGGDTAIQGSLLLAHTSGVYGSVWASSVNSGVNQDGTEFDVGVGFRKDFPLGKKQTNANLDIGIIRYVYAGSGKFLVNDRMVDNDYFEGYGALTLSHFAVKNDTLRLGVNLSPDYYFKTGKYAYLSIDYSIPVINNTLSLITHAGYNHFENAKALNDVLGTTLNQAYYMDYKAGVTFSLLGLNAELSYVGSEIKKADCPYQICNGHALFSLSKNF